jgi:hypothetical protein
MQPVHDAVNQIKPTMEKAGIASTSLPFYFPPTLLHAGLGIPAYLWCHGKSTRPALPPKYRQAPWDVDRNMAIWLKLVTGGALIPLPCPLGASRAVYLLTL